MKQTYALFFALLILASCGKDDEKVIEREKTDWASYKLNGDVNTLVEHSYETFDGKQKGPVKHENMSEHDRELHFTKDGMLNLEKTFSTDGKLFEEIRYKGKDFKQSHKQFVNGAPSLVTQFVWDEKGKNNLSVTRRNADNTPFDKIVMKYKGDKLLERITYNNQESQANKVVYNLDKDGNVSGEAYYLTTDVIQYKTEYTYNDKRQKITEKHFNSDGAVDYTTTYTYNGDKVQSSQTTNGKGEVTYIEKNGYDSKGNIISHYTFDKFDGIAARDEYKYDAKGNRTEWKVYKDDKLTLSAAYSYDKYGNPNKSLTTDQHGNVLDSRIYKYEYDKQDNWIRKVFYSNDKPSIITERKISYHKKE